MFHWVSPQKISWFHQIAQNYAETVSFHKNFRTRKLGEIMVFFGEFWMRLWIRYVPVFNKLSKINI